MNIGNFFKRFGIVILLIIIAAGAVYYWQRSSQTATTSTYQTVAAVRGSLTANVGATGTVRAGQSASLTWQTSGRVETVTAKIGDSVQADSVLASLVQTSMSQSIILAQADLISAQKNLSDLMASNTNLAQAEQNLANAKQAVKDAQDKVDSISYKRASDNLVMQTQANIAIANRDLMKAEDNYKLFAHRPDGDASKAQALLTVTNLRLKIVDLTQKLNYYTGKPTNLDAEKYKANLVVAQAQQADAQREVDRLQNGPTSDDVASAKAKIAAAQSTINQSKIIAPFNGVITQAEPAAGDMVAPGTLAYRMDDLSNLLVDLQISEVDINNISVDQPVSITFDAVQGKAYAGKVIKISQAGDSSGSGVNFTVTVQLTQTDQLVKPGMTAAVTITVKEISNALLVQNRAVRQVNGKRVVYVLQNNKPVAVDIQLGATSDVNSEVIGGNLKEGDLVIINPPSTTSPFGG